MSGDEIVEALPEDVDPELWFYSETCGRRDYLFDSHWHTFPGRMSAFCPHDELHPDYRISLDELPKELPSATKYFVRGFLAGNLPAAPVGQEDDDPVMVAWRKLAVEFSKTGYWNGGD